MIFQETKNKENYTHCTNTAKTIYTSARSLIVTGTIKIL